MRGNLSDARPVLVLLSGLPGTGKTTFAKRLARKAGVTHLESDAVRHALFDSPSHSKGENAAVFAEIEELARRELRAGRSVAVDATNLSRRDRARFLALGRRAGVRTIGVRITAPATVLSERLSLPRRGYSSARLAVLQRMDGRAEPFSIPALVLDSRFSLEPAVELVTRLLEDRS